MNGKQAVAALRPEPGEATLVVVSVGSQPGTPVYAFGYTSDLQAATKAAAYLFRNHATYGETIEVRDVATPGDVEPLPTERRALIPELSR